MRRGGEDLGPPVVAAPPRRGGEPAAGEPSRWEALLLSPPLSALSLFSRSLGVAAALARYM
eukprot:scaffold96810_cov27-Tisochrysis_lutea.AAC.1